MDTDHPNDRQLPKRPFHDSLELVRRNVNILQMLLDTNNKEKAFTMQHERYAKDANKCLEKAIAINSGLLLSEFKNYTKRESVVSWLDGDTNSISRIVPNQLPAEIEETEEVAAHILSGRMRNGLIMKPYQLEIIMRIQQRGMRRQAFYNNELEMLSDE